MGMSLTAGGAIRSLDGDPSAVITHRTAHLGGPPLALTLATEEDVVVQRCGRYSAHGALPHRVKCLA